jgi:hypothetical protein
MSPNNARIICTCTHTYTDKLDRHKDGFAAGWGCKHLLLGPKLDRHKDGFAAGWGCKHLLLGPKLDRHKDGFAAGWGCKHLLLGPPHSRRHLLLPELRTLLAMRNRRRVVGITQRLHVGLDSGEPLVPLLGRRGTQPQRP